MVTANKTSYEETRQKRLEENKKRIEQLNLKKLAQSLKPICMKKAKAKVPKLKQPIDSSSVRRSGRVAEKTPVNYKEDVPVEREERSRTRRYGSGHSKRELLGRVDASEEDVANAKRKAEDLQSSLSRDIPSFVKSMLHSHVSAGYWLGIPADFSEKHLPKHDETIYLIDGEGKEFKNNYLARKSGLSGGWVGFAKCHNLVYGDAVVFQLTEPTTFKVYIIRASKPED